MSSYSNYLGSKKCCSNNLAKTVVGPVGPQGFQGAIGPYGFQGATGTQGIRGATGPCCRGPTGAQGDPGDPGGPTGPQGVTGAQGVTGPQGVTGAQGVTGSQGSTGSSQWNQTTYIGVTGPSYTGIGYTGDVMIFGALHVSGGIDPTYLALEPQLSNPLPNGLDGIWIEDNSSAPQPSQQNPLRTKSVICQEDLTATTYNRILLAPEQLFVNQQNILLGTSVYSQVGVNYITIGDERNSAIDTAIISINSGFTPSFDYTWSGTGMTTYLPFTVNTQELFRMEQNRLLLPTTKWVEGRFLNIQPDRTATFDTDTNTLNIVGSVSTSFITYQITIPTGSQTISAISITNMNLNAIYEVTIYKQGLNTLTINSTITNAKTTFASNITVPAGGYALLTIKYLNFNNLGNTYVVDCKILYP